MDRDAVRQEVSTSPVAGSSSRGAMQNLLRPSDDRLVLSTNWPIRIIAAALALVGITMLLGLWQVRSWEAADGRRVSGVMGSLMLLMGAGVWLAPQRAVFDRQIGKLWARRWWQREEYPLDQILAVQVIPGGRGRTVGWGTYRTQELNLVLNNGYMRRLNLTNHGDDATTLRMAHAIGDFLRVPVWSEVHPNAVPPDIVASSGRMLRGRAVTLCFTLAAALGLISIPLSLSQARLEQLAAEARPVQARLISTQVREWSEGTDNWGAFGTFAIEQGEFQGEATANLIPQKAYREHGRRNSIPRDQAESFLGDYQVGRVYDAYLYPDAADRLFFERPGTGSQETVRWLRLTAAGLVLMGVLAAVLRIPR